MLQLFISILVFVARNLPANNPAYLDILKVVVGSITWIGGLVGYVYWREKNLKAAAANK